MNKMDKQNFSTLFPGGPLVLEFREHCSDSIKIAPVCNFFPATFSVSKMNCLIRLIPLFFVILFVLLARSVVYFCFFFLSMTTHTLSNFDPCRNQKTFRPKKSAPSGSKVGGLFTCGMVTGLFSIFFFIVYIQPTEPSMHFDYEMQGAQLQKHIDATLGSGNLREAVKLPPGEDINEWLAVNSKYL